MAEELPLVHTSRCKFLPELAKNGHISPRRCEVFQESLIYLFYGRPAYRSKQGRSAGESIVLCPVCFVFKPRTVSRNVARVFPCDTGALHKGIFQPHLTAADIKELELDPAIESARRYVHFFFKTNGNYFLGKVNRSMSAPNYEATQKLYQLLLSSVPSKFDDRKSAVEVQTREKLFLKDQLLYVVLPCEFLDDVNIREAIFEHWNCDPILYPTFDGDAPNQYYSVLREKLGQRFMDSKRI